MQSMPGEFCPWSRDSIYDTALHSTVIFMRWEHIWVSFGVELAHHLLMFIGGGGDQRASLGYTPVQGMSRNLMDHIVLRASCI